MVIQFSYVRVLKPKNINIPILYKNNIMKFINYNIIIIHFIRNLKAIISHIYGNSILGEVIVIIIIYYIINFFIVVFNLDLQNNEIFYTLLIIKSRRVNIYIKIVQYFQIIKTCTFYKINSLCSFVDGQTFKLSFEFGFVTLI